MEAETFLQGNKVMSKVKYEHIIIYIHKGKMENINNENVFTTILAQCSTMV